MNSYGELFCRHTRPPVRKALSIRTVNSFKLFFPAHFRDVENNISHNFYSFNLTLGLLKIYILLLLNVFTISIDEDISRTNFGHHTGYFWNFPISHIIQNHWKNKFYYKFFCFSLTVEHIQLCKFYLRNCLWLPIHTAEKNKILTQKWLLRESSSRHINKNFKKQSSFIDLSVEV